MPNSGQLSGRDVTSSHLPEPGHWPEFSAAAAAAATAAAAAAATTIHPSSSPFTAAQHKPYAAVQSPYAAATAQRRPSATLRTSTADAIQLARAASNAAKQSLAATAAITDPALPRKGSSSLLADLRQAERQWSDAKQGAAPAQAAPAQAAVKALPEVKRSSRQAARAADQAQTQLASEQPEQMLLPTCAAQQADAVVMVHSGLPQLRWGTRKHVERVRRHRRQLAKPLNEQFLGWTVAGGVLKPVAPRCHQSAAAIGTPKAAQVHPRASLGEGGAVRAEPWALKYESKVDEPQVATIELVKAEPIHLLAAAAAVKAREEIAPAFIPRHSRKKVRQCGSGFVDAQDCCSSCSAACKAHVLLCLVPLSL